MAHVREELTLGVVRRLSDFFGLLEFYLCLLASAYFALQLLVCLMELLGLLPAIDGQGKMRCKGECYLDVLPTVAIGPLHAEGDRPQGFAIGLKR